MTVMSQICRLAVALHDGIANECTSVCIVKFVVMCL